VLDRIAIGSGPLETRLQALARIDEGELLVDVALHAGFEEAGTSVRLAAVARITAAADLARLAREGDDLTAPAAVRRIDDQVVLAAVYKEAAKDVALHRPVMEAAVEKITDQSFLAEVVRAGYANDSNERVRALALEHIHDDALLLALAKARTPVARQSVARLHDQAALADVALGAEDVMARSDAINRLGDQAVLARIAKGHPLNTAAKPSPGQAPTLTWEQDSALKGMTDRVVLAELARSKDVALARAAGQRLAAVKATVLVDAGGELFEPRLGQPLAQYRLEAFNEDGRFVAEATTDGLGHFQLRGLSAGKWTLTHGREQAVVTVPLSGGNLGRVPFQDAALVESAFGPVCEKPSPVEKAPAVPLLVLATEGWRPGSHWAPDTTYSWDRPWSALLCLRKTSKAVGRYVDAKGLPTGTAYSTTWGASLVRLRDGHVFESTFSADPPGQTTTGARSGDPSSQLAAWLKTIGE
jgi:hypothetical protein